MAILDFQIFPTLTTKRLLLRQLIATDASAVFQLRTNKEVNKFIERPSSKREKNGKEFIARMGKEFEENTSLNWVISLKEKKKLIGSICLWNFSKNNTYAEVGYSLFTDYQHKGIMTEALNKIVDFGFYELGFTAIEAYTQKDNLNSIKLLTKTGFTRNPLKNDIQNPRNHIYTKTNPTL